MRLLAVLIAFLFVVPLFSTLLAVAANARAGKLGRARALCGGRLLAALCRSCLNSALSLALALLAWPLGGLGLPAAPPRPSQDLPVLLVHGLYHNASAWLVFRQRLRAAGFRAVLVFSYSSFGPSFAEIVIALREDIASAAQASPTGRVLLVGHSLGGLLIRAACSDRDVCGRVAGVVTLGSPHRGSLLARWLAVGRLGRGLRPGGEALRFVEGGRECPAPALSVFSATDGMVLPLSGSLLTEQQTAAGWRERCVVAVSHVGLLYSERAASWATSFLRSVAQAGAGYDPSNS